MRAALFNGPKAITVGERPDPVIQEPTDAVVRVTLACVCGSDHCLNGSPISCARGVAGTINPGLVFDHVTDLDHTPEAYAAVDERRAIKSLLRVGAP